MADDNFRKLKAAMVNWREIILPIHSVLLWEKQWHPCALIGGTTILFTSIWLLDPSLLTTVSILGLTITISDYIVPLLTTSMLKADTWSEKKERQLENVCEMMLCYYENLKGRLISFHGMRTSKPRLYYGTSIISLLLLAWIGNNINNLFLTYVFITFLLLTPGMEHNGILHMYGKVLMEKIGDMATNARLKVGQSKKEE